MRFRRARDHAPSKKAYESLVRSHEDLADQRLKHDRDKVTEDKLVAALERNHVAELMLEALQRKMS